MIEFVPDKPIFRQVADYCSQRIIDGTWATEQRIPSTKELAVTLAINNRTVMKAYDNLSDAGVIYQRRGMGYYVAPDAIDRMHDMMRRDFMATVLPELIGRMRMAAITPAELAELVSVAYDADYPPP